MTHCQKKIPQYCSKLAKILSYAFSGPLTIIQLKELLESHHRQANANKIVIPKVNSEIWSTLSLQAKQRDAKALQVQRTIAQSTYYAVEAAKNSD